jgi:hypothetical protein
MKIKVDGSIQWNSDIKASTFLKKRNLEIGGKVRRYIDTEFLKYSYQYIPFATGRLADSGKKNTKIGSGNLVWSAVDPKSGFNYASQVYFGTDLKFNKQHHPKAQALWMQVTFINHERQILEGAAKIAKASKYFFYFK